MIAIPSDSLIDLFFNHFYLVLVLENNSKVAIVTGASSGIGYATTLALLRGGTRVAAGARRLDRLQKHEDQIVKNGDDAEKFMQKKLYVTSKSDCDSYVDAVIRKWGRIDILVNNAGLMP